MSAVKDKDRFIMQSKAGDQWFACVLLEDDEKKANGQFRYEIVKVFYSETRAKVYIDKANMFKNDNVKVVRKKRADISSIVEAKL